MQQQKTPEQHHDELIEAVEYELNTYGPASLADVIASLVSNRADEDQPDAEWWQKVQNEYENLAGRLARTPKGA